MNPTILSLIILIINLGTASVSLGNDQMTRFLKSCAYGTLGGAALGLVSISFSDDPGGRVNQVARGASLGLYAGIGYGYYLTRQEKISDESVFHQNQMNPDRDSLARIAPLVDPSKRIDGALIDLMFSF